MLSSVRAIQMQLVSRVHKKGFRKARFMVAETMQNRIGGVETEMESENRNGHSPTKTPLYPLNPPNIASNSPILPPPPSPIT